jgi:DNA-binding transcriptional regulator YiaG
MLSAKKGSRSLIPHGIIIFAMTLREIRNLRKVYGLSQGQFGAMLHVTRETVARWENGSQKPIRALAAAMEQMGPQQHRAPTAYHLTPFRIKDLRKKLRLSQKQFAERLKVRRETVARWEAGIQLPHPVYVSALNHLADGHVVKKQSSFV